MTKSIPTIQRYMTTAPHSMGLDQTVAHAAQMMVQHDVRFLPVLVGGTLAGIVSDRDLRIIEGLGGVDAMKVTVEEAMTQSVYAVSPDARLDEVIIDDGDTQLERRSG